MDVIVRKIYIAVLKGKCTMAVDSMLSGMYHISINGRPPELSISPPDNDDDECECLTCDISASHRQIYRWP